MEQAARLAAEDATDNFVVGVKFFEYIFDKFFVHSGVDDDFKVRGYAFEEAKCVGSESDVIFVVAFSDLKIVGVGFLFVPEEKCVFQL